MATGEENKAWKEEVCYTHTSQRGNLACYAGPQGKTSEWRNKTEVLGEFRPQPLLGFLWERQGRLNNLRLASLINLGRI